MLTIDGSQGRRGTDPANLADPVPVHWPALLSGQHSGAARRARSAPQHLQAVTAAAQLAEAEVSGAAVGSRELIFQPRRFGAAIAPGSYRFDIGTAGSTSLVLQTVLLPLLLARGASTVTLVGGTYNKGSAV